MTVMHDSDGDPTERIQRLQARFFQRLGFRGPPKWDSDVDDLLTFEGQRV